MNYYGPGNGKKTNQWPFKSYNRKTQFQSLCCKFMVGPDYNYLYELRAHVGDHYTACRDHIYAI